MEHGTRSESAIDMDTNVQSTQNIPKIIIHPELCGTVRERSSSLSKPKTVKGQRKRKSSL